MNVVPYIDVMLVLLVIFMVTAPMLTQGVKIELPKLASEALVNDKQQTILTLSVKADGGYYWNLGSELDTKNQTDSAVNLDELQAKIDAWHREKGLLGFALRGPDLTASVVDVLVRPEIAYDRLAAAAVEGELAGRRIKIASIEHLLEMKRAANRPKDQLDIAALEKIQRGEDPNG